MRTGNRFPVAGLPLPLPERKSLNDYQSVHYVYLHRCPEKKEIVYVGHGSNERAWRCTTLKRAKNNNYGHRAVEHAQWCQELICKGFLPGDWVEIVARNLSKSAACLIEQDLTREYKPKFNMALGQKLLKISKEGLELAEQLKKAGASFTTIAKELNVSAMTAWRALSGKNLNDPA